MSNICILGTGMAGYGAAARFKQAGKQAILFDGRDHFGGHTASHRYEGCYTFDEGPHISFTKDERIRKIFAQNVNEQFESFNARVNNYWRGYWIKHPAQVNLHGLPPDLIISILKDVVEAQQSRRPVSNYEEWLRASFGNTFAETFPMEYTLKYHTTSAANLSTDWIGPRLYQAKLEEWLRGALSPSSPDVHYITEFRYPSSGGFVSYLRPFMETADVRLNHKVVSIDPGSKEIRFANDGKVHYSGIVSSIPLPDLVPMILGAPSEVREAAAKLACSELVVVNLVVNRPDLIDAHWTYFYDRDIVVSRLSTPHLQARGNVPPGCGSLQAECYFSKKYSPLTRKPEEYIDPVIRDLGRCGVLREGDKILFKNAMHIEYANVIFDLERAAALAIVHGFLDEIGVAYCGRYGDWAYIWTDESFLSGERAAEKTLAR